MITTTRRHDITEEGGDNHNKGRCYHRGRKEVITTTRGGDSTKEGGDNHHRGSEITEEITIRGSDITVRETQPEKGMRTGANATAKEVIDT